jgi:hypothetical protein
MASSVDGEEAASASLGGAVRPRVRGTVTLRGRSWAFDGLELVAIADVEPYIESRRRMRDRHLREHERRTKGS